MARLITAEYFQEQMATLGLKASFAPSAYMLDTLIIEASDWVQGYTDRKFELQSASQVLRGPNKYSNKLILDDYPVTAVASVAYEEDSGTTGTVDPALLRILSGGILEFKNPLYGPWRSDRTYTVNYTTGYASIPSNVQRATALKLANLVQPQYQGPQDREVFMVTNLEQLIVDLLEPFRRERIG